MRSKSQRLLRAGASASWRIWVVISSHGLGEIVAHAGQGDQASAGDAGRCRAGAAHLYQWVAVAVQHRVGLMMVLIAGPCHWAPI